MLVCGSGKLYARAIQWVCRSFASEQQGKGDEEGWVRGLQWAQADVHRVAGSTVAYVQWALAAADQNASVGQEVGERGGGLGQRGGQKVVVSIGDRGDMVGAGPGEDGAGNRVVLGDRFGKKSDEDGAAGEGWSNDLPMYARYAGGMRVGLRGGPERQCWCVACKPFSKGA